MGYKCILTACSFILALFTRIKKKEFKTVNIIVMAYLFAITFGLGVPVYTIVSFINVGMTVRFIILCLLIDSIVYICLFSLFLPSIIPLIKEKIGSRDLYVPKTFYQLWIYIIIIALLKVLYIVYFTYVFLNSYNNILSIMHLISNHIVIHYYIVEYGLLQI